MIEGQILKRVETAIEAHGGEEFDREKCECNPHKRFKCNYCKIYFALIQCKDYFNFKLNEGNS